MSENNFEWSLPQLRIAGPNARLVKEKQLDEGCWFFYYLNGDWEELPRTLKICIAAVRMKAMDWVVIPPVTCLDEKSEVFEAIKKRSNADQRECQWGPEYSISIEGEGEALLWLGNKSSRPLRSMIRIGGTYQIVPNRQEEDGYVWYTPSVVGI